jgi:Protein of unknown function (DUF3577)/Fe2+ transport protein
MSELKMSNPTTYFNLRAEGCGYLNRVRTVKPEKGQPYLACTIAAKHGDATSPITTKFDCRVSGSRAQSIVGQLEADVKAEKKVFIGFRIGDFVPELFVYQNGKRKGETGVVNKGRLLQVTFAKVDGQTVELPAEETVATEEPSA